ncbi:MAG TPA: thymidine phosphorylase [Spirochaetes bacterium]|nr:thymidine phosphorylase [Spirochaetota bacterium]
MRASDLIVKKRNRKEHTYGEIQYLVNSYTRGEIPDYQISAWLMAAFLNGMNEDETFYLTKAMLLSGKTIDLGSIAEMKIDKHSTGGVGDKISLILAPAVAACGVVVPMTSGRGLGFTGGTLDKLESISGFNVNLTEAEFISTLKTVGYAMTGQTDQIAPADKKLYALRDVTGTVESIPLITASILSKKLAEGADGVVFDVKFGTGAFMKTKKEAESLARSLASITKKMGKKAVCVLTCMDRPLGKAVGNSLEVIESIECLNGAEHEDIIEIVRVLGGHMLVAGGVVSTADKGESMIHEKLKNGEAFDKFKDSVRAQGGDVDSIINTEKLPRARNSRAVYAHREGRVISMNTEQVGTAAIFLGAGRLTKEDSIDPAPGIIIEKKTGDFVKKGDKLATLFYNRETNLEQAAELMVSSYTINKNSESNFQLIHDVIE